MNICAFGRSLPVHQLGGMEYHFEDLACALKERGHSVTIITTHHPSGIEYEKKKGVEIYYLKKTLPGRYESGFWKESVRKFKELEKIKKFDLIWSESIAAHGYLKEKVKGQFSLPVVLIAHGTFWGQLLTKLKRRTFSLSTIVGIFKNLYGSILERKVYSDVDLIIAITQIVAEALIKDLNVAQEKIRIIPNGVDVEKFKPDNNLRNSFRKKLHLRENERVILSAGRLHPAKGVQIIISALPFILKQIPVKLIIIGEGNYGEKLRQLAKKLRIEDKIIFVGRVSREELTGYYNACDLFVLPTMEQESLPLTLLEAMACEKPVVTSKAIELPSILKDKKSGIVLKAGTSETIARAIVTVLKDKKLADSLAKRGREKVSAEYSFERSVDEIETLFMEAVKR